MLKYCIVIPCFNESKRILNDEYLKFTKKNNDFHILFVDDGSTDNTIDVLNILTEQSNQISTLKLPINKGKANAIREGMLAVLNTDQANYFGYLDADLAIPFSELLRLKEELAKGYEYSFSSKQETEGSELEIKLKRHFVGRLLSMMVRSSLKIKIYDTQCGCKLMTKQLAQTAFDAPFFSSWLFDIEIIWRIVIKFGKPFFSKKAIEIPVKKLLDRGSSRIKATDLFSLPFEFLKIHFYYKKFQ